MAAESKQATSTRTINAAEFKATCLELLDEVAESGEELVITKNGRPVSRLVPYREPRLASVATGTISAFSAISSRHAARVVQDSRMLIRTCFDSPRHACPPLAGAR